MSYEDERLGRYYHITELYIYIIFPLLSSFDEWIRIFKLISCMYIHCIIFSGLEITIFIDVFTFFLMSMGTLGIEYCIFKMCNMK